MNGSDIAIFEFLRKHAEKNSISFHMPGHKAGNIFKRYGYCDQLNNLAMIDITEIDGADNLFQPESIISKTMEKYRELYESNSSHLLVNGSSSGIIAAILAICDEGDSILVARNSHKSIFAALALGKINPVYIHPTLMEEWGVAGQISPSEVAKMLDENEKIKAVILPSPNYYGILSPISEIADEVHKRDKVLIVDQAHGAHLKFFDSYCMRTQSSSSNLLYHANNANSYVLRAAENQGADIIINSIHKTLASFTQSAVVNIMSDRVDKYKFMEKMQLMQSTSPSYLLMASLDINADILTEYKETIIADWHSNLEYFYGEIVKIDGIRCMIHTALDDTKINIDASGSGINGRELSQLLIDRNIYPEMVTQNIVTFMTGIGNERGDYEALISVLSEIVQHIEINFSNNEIMREESLSRLQKINKILELKHIPTNKQRIKLEEAVGKVSASIVTPYPPGIPAICPGEVYSKECVEYLLELRKRGYNILGIDEQLRVSVGMD